MRAIDALPEEHVYVLFRYLRPKDGPGDGRAKGKVSAYNLFSGFSLRQKRHVGGKHMADGKNATHDIQPEWFALKKEGQAYWHLVAAVVNKRRARK